MADCSVTSLFYIALLRYIEYFITRFLSVNLNKTKCICDNTEIVLFHFTIKPIVVILCGI